MIEEITQDFQQINIDQAIKIAINLVHDGFLPKLTFEEERPLQKEDFQQQIQDRSLIFEKLKKALEETNIDLNRFVIAFLLNLEKLL